MATYGTGDEVKRRIDSENPDVVVTARVAFDDILKQGKIVPDSVVDVARTFVGFAVHAGAPKPDISSVEAVKRSLHAAKAVVYADPASGSASANHLFASWKVSDSPRR